MSEPALAARWAVRLACVLGCIVGALALGSRPAAAASTKTVTVTIGASCVSTGQLCLPRSAAGSYNSLSSLKVTYTAASTHCSNVAVGLFVDGHKVASTGFVPANGMTSATVPWPTDGHRHALSVQGEGQKGGCNGGMLGDWAGTLTITYTPAPACSARKGGRRTRTVVAVAAADCPLTVTAVPRQKSKSGLSRDDSSGAAFIADTGASNKCLSGCTDVLVTVTDPSKHNKPVKGADVSASVTPIFDKSLQYPSGQQSGGFLCKAADPTSCGSGRLLTGLKTDAKGHVSLLYWAPGVLTKLGTTLTVKATNPCGSCSSGRKAGETNPTITVSPNLIYQHSGTLSLEEVKGLAEWASSGGFFALAKGQAIELLLEAAIKHEIEEEKLAESVANGVSGILKVAEFGHALWEQQGFEALFVNGFNLSTTGLGCAPDNATVSANACADFTLAFANGGAPPLHLFAKGLVWQLAQRLAYIEANPGSGPPLAAMTIHLSVDEVSYCEQGAECTPGYHGRRGIHPFLHLYFTAGDPLNVSFVGSIVVRYNARAWMDAQTF
jgi:hypothetical protein